MSKTSRKPEKLGLEKRLEKLEKRSMVQLVRDLMKISAKNRAFVTARLSAVKSSRVTLAPYQKRIVNQFFPSSGVGNLDLDEACRAIREYRRATGDIAGTLELMITYVETGMRFAREFNGMNGELSDSLTSILAEFAGVARRHRKLFPRWEERLHRVEELAGDTGYGFAELVSEILDEIDALFSRPRIANETPDREEG